MKPYILKPGFIIAEKSFSSPLLKYNILQDLWGPDSGRSFAKLLRLLLLPSTFLPPPLKIHMGRGKPLEKKNYQERTIFSTKVLHVKGEKNPLLWVGECWLYKPAPQWWQFCWHLQMSVHDICLASQRKTDSERHLGHKPLPLHVWGSLKPHSMRALWFGHIPFSLFYCC